MILVTIPGEPHALKRQRMRVMKLQDGRVFARTHKDAGSLSWQATAQLHFVEAMDGRKVPDGPVELRIRAIFACPKSAHRKREPRPAEWSVCQKDADNIAKAVQDAGNGVLWLDDRQVARLTVEKIRGAQGEAPRVEVRVLPLTPGGVAWSEEPETPAAGGDEG